MRMGFYAAVFVVASGMPALAQTCFTNPGDPVLRLPSRTTCGDGSSYWTTPGDPTLGLPSITRRMTPPRDEQYDAPRYQRPYSRDDDDDNADDNGNDDDN